MDKRPALMRAEDGSVLLSPSQLNTFELCPRKWAWNRINGVREPQKAAAALGEAVHNQLELYLKNGKNIDTSTKAGQIAMSGIEWMPTPQTPGMRVEEWFAFPYGGFVFRGKKDFEIVDRDPRPLVSDHKTTSNFRWAQTPDTLEDDFQAAIYAADAMIKSGKSEVDLQWTYFKTVGGRASEPVKKVMTEDMVERTMLRVIQVAENLRFVGEEYTDAKQVPYNADACEAYGGCYYADHCKLTAKEKLKAIMAQQNTQTLLEKLRKKKEAAAAAAKQTAPEITEEFSPTPGKKNEINPPDKPPPPPDARQDSKGNWVQAVWDPGHQEWVFPAEEFEAEVVPANADVDKPEKKRVAKPQKKVKLKAVPDPVGPETPPTISAASVLESFADLIAAKVAERLSGGRD